MVTPNYRAAGTLGPVASSISTARGPVRPLLLRHHRKSPTVYHLPMSLLFRRMAGVLLKTAVAETGNQLVQNAPAWPITQIACSWLVKA